LIFLAAWPTGPSALPAGGFCLGRGRLGTAR
jgi:hypothetical protein